MGGVAASFAAVAVGFFFFCGSGGCCCGSSGGSAPAPSAPSVPLRRRAPQPRVPQGLGGGGAALRVVLEHRHQEVGEGGGLFFFFFERVEVSFFPSPSPSFRKKENISFFVFCSVSIVLAQPLILSKEKKRVDSITCID